MNVLVDYQGPWGLGDLLCSDPMILGLAERFGDDARIVVRGRAGNVLHNPRVAGVAKAGATFDHVVEVKLFTHLPPAEYARLEAMPSLIDHMCSYAGVQPSDRRPRLWLQPDDLAVLRELRLPPRPRIAICADWLDPLRHWPVDRWRTVAALLAGAGASVIGIGLKDRLGLEALPNGLDLVGRLTMRETAAVLTACDLFAGNNSGLFHYAQAAGVPCVTLFSLAVPQRFVHPGAHVTAVQADGLPCLHCMTRCFESMQRTGCIAAPKGRCMTDIPVERVLDAIEAALRETAARRRAVATFPAG